MSDRHSYRSEKINYSDCLAPRFWPTWIALAAMRLIANLPHTLQIGLGKLLGLLIYRLARSRRHIAETNIALCFPELSATAQKQLAKDSIIENAIGFVETCIAWWNPERITPAHITVEGEEHLRLAREQGRGVLLVGAHYSTLDLGGLLVSHVDKVSVMYRAHKNPLFNLAMQNARIRFCNSVIERSNMREVIRCFKKGDIVWYAPDQDYGRKHSVFAPFFDIDAATITATSRIAKINKSPVLILGHHRNSNNKGYTISYTPLNTEFPSGDDVVDATVINQALETQIKKHPAQYMWVHRRFKTRPQGQEKIY